MTQFKNHLSNAILIIPRGIHYLIYCTYTNLLDILYAFKSPILLKYKILSFLFETIFDIYIMIFKHRELKKDGALTYGSTPLHTAIKIIGQVANSKTKSFLDLGSGRGNLVFTAALGHKLESTGIELIESHIYFSKLMATIFRKYPITIEKKDFIKEVIPQSDIIFASNTCFPPFMEILLTQKLEVMPKGTTIISLSAPLKSDKIKIYDQKQYLFSWGKGTVYFQKVI